MKNRLREVRYRTNLTLSSASRLLGINSDTLAKYERGEREPRLKTWQKLADLFNVLWIFFIVRTCNLSLKTRA